MATGARAFGLNIDVSDREAMLNVESTLPAEIAEPAILVNTAGLALGVEPLLRQPLDHPQRVSRSLVKMHHVVFVVARAMAYWSAMLECRVSWRRGRTAADPGSSGT